MVEADDDADIDVPRYRDGATTPRARRVAVSCLDHDAAAGVGTRATRHVDADATSQPQQKHRRAVESFRLFASEHADAAATTAIPSKPR